MKITGIRTFRVNEFANVLWVHIETNAGITGLGETFYGAQACEAHIHNTLAARLLGKDPLNIESLNKEMLSLPNAQASTGVEYRAASAVDIALLDIFGKAAGLPVHTMLGGQSWDKVRIYNTCAGTRYVRSNDIKPVNTWNRGASGPYEDLDAFMTNAGALAENLLEQGISAMKIWPFDPPAIENQGQFITNEQMRSALAPFESIRKAVGDKIDVMVEMHCLWNLPVAQDIARELVQFKPRWCEDPIRMNNPQALADFRKATPIWSCASETLGSRFAYKDYLDKDAIDIVMSDLCWTGGLTEGRKIAALADLHHKPFAPHDCIGPVGFIAAVHMSVSQPNTFIQESVRAFYRGWYLELVTQMPRIEGGYVYPMEAPGLGVELLPSFFERSDLQTRYSELN